MSHPGCYYSSSECVAMGLAAVFVLAASNLVISLLRNFIPDKIRIPSYIVVIAAFVTIVGMLMEAFVPELYKALGLFIPLIVVNCIIYVPEQNPLLLRIIHFTPL